MDDQPRADTYQNALHEANRLYERYVELAHLVELCTETDERDLLAWTERSLDHPLGLTIKTE